MEKQERKEREFQARRTEIMERAEKVFSAKGFHNVTMAEIAGASGFSIGSLYQFFPGKEQLYAAMIIEKLDLMYGQIRAEASTADNVIDKIAKLVEAHFHFVEENADFCMLILRGENIPVSDIMTSLRQKLLDGYLRHLALIENVLKSGMKNGIIRRLNSRDTAALLFGLIRAAAIDWMLVPANAAALKSKKDFILDVFLRGVQKDEQ
jgi:AcrR family transcriptional regulator